MWDIPSGPILGNPYGLKWFTPYGPHINFSWADLYGRAHMSPVFIPHAFSYSEIRELHRILWSSTFQIYKLIHKFMPQLLHVIFININYSTNQQEMVIRKWYFKHIQPAINMTSPVTSECVATHYFALNREITNFYALEYLTRLI